MHGVWRNQSCQLPFACPHFHLDCLATKPCSILTKQQRKAEQKHVNPSISSLIHMRCHLLYLLHCLIEHKMQMVMVTPKQAALTPCSWLPMSLYPCCLWSHQPRVCVWQGVQKTYEEHETGIGPTSFQLVQHITSGIQVLVQVGHADCIPF